MMLAFGSIASPVASGHRAAIQRVVPGVPCRSPRDQWCGPVEEPQCSRARRVMLDGHGPGTCAVPMANEAERERDAPTCVMYAGRGIASDNGELPRRPAEELLGSATVVTSASVLLVDGSLVERVGDASAVPDHVVIVATDEPAASTLGRRADLSIAGITDAAARRAVLRAACEVATARIAATRSEAEFQELSRIGIGLMREHDRKALLRLIVGQCKRLTHSDGGGLLLIREDEDGRQWLRPVLYAFDSIDGDFLSPASRYPVDDTSIVGHAALLKQPVVVADAYNLPHSAVFELNIEFDERYGYRRRSMLVIPMIDQRDRVLGLLVCVNRKTDPRAMITTKEAADRYVIEYSEREVRLARMLASQAAAAIENVRLHAQIKRAFESFAEASVSAFDLRDPATAGHSLRVAAQATALAEAVQRKEDGPYRDVRFSPAQMRELHVAALLHDIGKIAVREEVLLKAKKLPPALWERIDARFDLIGRTMELESCRSRSHPNTESDDERLVARLKELERFREVVRAANEPTVSDVPTADLLDVAQRTYQRRDGSIAPYLNPGELRYLQLRKGTLDDRERAEVESHVTASQQYLSNIPWSEDLKHVAEYAYGHHELLNGEGYPRHLEGDEIPLQTRLITVADMFDALTASDRPYKPAVSVDQALEMLRKEAEAGRLDAEIVKVMTESESYRNATTTNWREL